MDKNTWGFQFVKVDFKEDEFQTILSLNTGDEEKTRTMFNIIKSEYPNNKSESSYILDLLDEEDDIIDDYSLTKEQVLELTKRFGYEVNL